MKKELLSISVLLLTPLFHVAAHAEAFGDQPDLGKPVLCTHESEAIEVEMVTERKIKLQFRSGATASLNFSKQVQPNGETFFQYKGKTTGLDYKTTTAYLSPDHSTLLLPHSDENTGTYIQYGCQEFVATP